MFGGMIIEGDVLVWVKWHGACPLFSCAIHS